MLLLLIRKLLYLDIKNNYFSRFSIVIELLGSSITLFIYWFTSKTFLPETNSSYNFYQGDYFSYLLIGEYTFLIGNSFYYTMIEKVKYFSSNDMLETVILSDRGLANILSLLSFSTVPRQILTIIANFALAHLFFDFSMSYQGLAFMIAIQLLALPCFIGLGLAGSSILLRLGKGGSLLGFLAIFGQFFSGVYFPKESLPLYLVKLFDYISPYNSILELTRSFVAYHSLSYPLLIQIIINAFIFLLLGFFMLRKSLNGVRKVGQPIVFTS